MSGVISDNTVRSSGAVAPLSAATLDSSDPAIDTNPTDGLGTKWVNTTSGEVFICTNATAGENIWIGQDGTYVHDSRGMNGGGSSGGFTNAIQYVTIHTLGNATDFGDLTQIRVPAATDNGTTGRGIFLGGNRPDPSPGDDLYSNVIDYIAIDTTGNATDFGDITQLLSAPAAGSNGPGDRGVRAGGYQKTPALTVATIDYVTISTPGNAVSFGNLTGGRYNFGTSSNGTNDRCVFWGGIGLPASGLTLDYITVSSTGNATDFGDEIWATQPAASGYNWNVNGGTSNGNLERGIHAGGDSSGDTKIIQYITISTPSNSAQIADLTTASSPTQTSSGPGDRGIFFGINPSSSTIDYMTISSNSDAADFGDMDVDTRGGACSNGMT